MISFTLDSDRVINITRTDIRIGDDWLGKRKFKSSRNKWNNFWIGSGSLNGTQVSDLRTFDDDEKVVFAWIIANTDELINYALAVNKNMPKRSRLTWERMARGQIFERNVRRFLGPSARAALKEYDDFSHSKLILKRTIQPKLKTLNYYKGTIDGIGGPQTTKAIKAFEKANGLLIDGKLFGRERALLVKLASAETSTKKYVKKLESTDSISAAQKAEISKLKKRIDRISVRISALIKENLNLKRKINSSEKSNSGWDDDLKNTINGQKNIIKHMRIRIADLIKERNKLRNIENKSGGSNKYLIQVLENELNTLNIKYNIIVSQRDELQGLLDESKEADTKAQIQLKSLGTDLNLALARVAAEQRKVAAEQKKIAELEAKEKLRFAEEAKDLRKFRSQFFGELRKVMEGQEGVRIVGDRFVFSSEVLFSVGSANLGSLGKTEINKVAKIINQIAGEIPDGIDWILRVDGHTDRIPFSGFGKDYKDNWELSQARALSVVRYLMDDLKIPANRLAANGFGEFQPIDDRDTPEAYKTNRRIELKFTEK